MLQNMFVMFLINLRLQISTIDGFRILKDSYNEYSYRRVSSGGRTMYRR